MINERIIGTGTGADTVVPSEYFNTVLYTGNGGTQRIGGYINRGGVFNGSSSFIENTNTSIWSPSWTISLWFKTSNNSGRSPLFLFGRGSWTDGIELQSASANTVAGSYAEGSKYFVKNVSVNLDDNNWHHYCTTYDSSSDTIKLYIDGNEETGLTTGTGNSRQGSGYRIGRFFQTPEQWATGVIDQGRIFDREVTSSEVTTLYEETHASTTIATTDIFSDGSGVALYQLDGNANDTGLANGARKAIDTTDKAASFNGSSSKISFSSPYSHTTDNEDLSISGWFKVPTLFTSGYQTILGGDIANSSGNAGTVVLLLRYKSAGKYLIDFTRVFGTSARYHTGFTSSDEFTLTANTWTHFAFTYEGYNANKTNKLYINGSEVYSITPNTLTTSGNATNATLAWGQYRNGLSYFNGVLDDLRMYSDILTSSEVGYIYNHTTASIPTDNLVAYYNLDGNSNDTAGSNNGSDTNITYVQSTKKGVERIDSGAAAIFNGSSSSITGAPAVDNRNSKEYSVSLWFNTTSTTESCLFGGIEDTTQDPVFKIVLRTDGHIDLEHRSNVSSTINTIQGSTNFSDGRWHHIVAWIDNDQIALYVDGNAQPNSPLSLTNSGNCFVTSPAIGADNRRGTLTQFFNGTIDDVRIYTDVLTSTEVGYLYNNTTASIPTDNLEAYYKLDGNALDSANSFDGTESNVAYGFDGTASNVVYQEATKFTPDLVWIKNRDTTSDQVVFDSVRGVQKRIFPNETYQESNSSTSLTSFDSNGFTVGSDANINGNNNDIVAWCFNAGTEAAASNTDGTITSTVKANQDAGFSIVKFAGGNSSGTTVGHGLNTPIELLIVKNLNDSTDQWITWHKDIEQNSTSNNTFTLKGGSIVLLNSTSATIPSYSYDGQMGGTSGENLIAYCLHSVDGIQKAGSYTGTGVIGNLVDTGFEPAFVMIKRTDAADQWIIFDNERITALFPNLSEQELSGYNNFIKFASNGFIINTTDNSLNNSSGTYIYLAIAADPDTTTPVVENSFDVVTYTGNGGTQSIDVAFKPDLVWIKSRDRGTSPYTGSHYLFDTIRGSLQRIKAESTDAESTFSNSLTSFDANGFSLGTGSNVNYNNDEFVAWCWKAGDHDDNLPQINTEGTTDSIVSVNDASGFSIVKYTAGGTATVGHGLSQPPELIITKNLDITEQWFVYAEPAGTQKFLGLNTDSAATSNSGVYTSVGATTFTNNISGTSRTYINYCFTSITGYQKIGSYTGNGSSNGPTITTGFKPRFIMVKSTSHSGAWVIMDAARDAGRDDEWYTRLIPNQSAAEVDDFPTTRRYQILDTGFKVTNLSNSWNGSGRTYMYLAIK